MKHFVLTHVSALIQTYYNAYRKWLFGLRQHTTHFRHLSYFGKNIFRRKKVIYYWFRNAVK